MKTQGRFGELAADLLTDFPERFEDRKRIYALLPSGERHEFTVDGFWPHKGRIILKFSGIDSINDAEALLGSEVQIPASERAELESGEVYVSDLKGCSVTVAEPSGDRNLGEVADVMFGAGEAPLLVVREGKKEYLIPFVEQYTKALDTAAKQITLSLPEGMLELDAPLSSDEKRRQHEKQED